MGSDIRWALHEKLADELDARLSGQSEVLLRQIAHTKGESGVSENDICECGNRRGQHTAKDIATVGCRAFSLNRHSEPKTKGDGFDALCECGHNRINHSISKEGMSGHCGQSKCLCRLFSHEAVRVEVCECGHGKNEHENEDGSPTRNGCLYQDKERIFCPCPSYRYEPEESEPEVKECWIGRGPNGGWVMTGHPEETGWCEERFRASLEESLTAAGFTIIPNPNEGEGEKAQLVTKALTVKLQFRNCAYILGGERKPMWFWHVPGRHDIGGGPHETAEDAEHDARSRGYDVEPYITQAEGVTETHPKEAEERAEPPSFPHEITIAIEIWNRLRPLHKAARTRVQTVIDCMRDAEYAEELESE